MVKWKKTAYQLFLWIFLCAYLLVFGKVLFGDIIHENNTIILLLYLAVGVGIILLSYFLLHKCHKAVKKYYNIILVSFLLIYGGFVLINGFQLQFTPVFDMDAIYGGAIQWLAQGSFSNYYEYYGTFPIIWEQ